MRLRDFDHGQVAVEFDPATKRIELEEIERPLRSGENDGVCFFLEGTFLAVALHQGVLWLFCGNRSAPMSQVHVEVHGASGGTTREQLLSIEWPDATRDRLAYEPVAMLPGDPTPFVDEDLLDHGRWLADLSLNPEAQRAHAARWG
ncbi:MAG: hypothetical protein EDR02_18670 [Actinobacteria bacterium]|nr:MAG: hypothetical protein EDR02_18670 [Actinomycetota bacterium]RIK02212.1 MAG: hypothetical protein DCC48_18385 [Acidobacteriota bacterium]